MGCVLPLTGLAQALEIRLEWDANTDANLAGYRVYYGTASGTYSKTIDVGNRIRSKVDVTDPSQTYYFVVTAYNTAGLESAPSNEVAKSFDATREIDSTELLPATAEAPNGIIRQTWKGTANTQYNILMCTNLLSPTWEIIDTVTASSGGIIIWEYVIPGPGSGFFKAVLKPP
jgi:hypothetical protein